MIKTINYYILLLLLMMFYAIINKYESYYNAFYVCKI